jgi:hypothetical protein
MSAKFPLELGRANRNSLTVLSERVPTAEEDMVRR